MRKYLRTIKDILVQPGEIVRLLWWWLGVVTFLVLIPNIGLVIEVLFNQPTYAVTERLAIISGLYSNLFRYVFDPVTFSMLVLSIVLALNFLIISFVRQHNRQAKGRLRSALPMLISSHCVACGGSLLAPIASLITGGSSYMSSERYIKLQLFTVGLNLIAIAIAVWSLRKATRTASIIVSSQTNK